MVFIDENKINVIKIFENTGFKPKYNENTGELYKFVYEKISFVKNSKDNIWEMKVKRALKDDDILSLFIVFKMFDGIIDYGFINENGKKEILKQENLNLTYKDYYKEV